MAIQIQFRRGTAYEWHHINPILALAEMGIETDTNLFKIGNGALHWDDLDYGGIQGYSGSSGYSGSIGSMAVDNVLYVSKSGNDSHNGRSLDSSKLTIKAALAIATRGTTIFVKSGDYTELNPLTVPDFVSIIGDNLRSVTVRPSTVTDDLFYVNNGCYIAHMTFKDHVSPAAAVAFPPDGSAGVISTSPYVQNCTSMTSNGTGMRVDGSHALGTKSMMVDAFTQYNQGGIGIHMLNNGYTSLVSVFTICCDVGFLCETGGFCSITNSNSSFGNYALYADGVSESLYTGKLNGSQSGRTLVLDNLTTKPSIGDAISVGDGNYYTIASSASLKPGTDITYPYLLAEDAGLRNARQNILDAKTRLQVETINHIMATYPGFDFNQFKCSRDVATIINCISYDMVLDTNYQTIQAGTSYYRAASNIVIDSQLTETVNAITFLKSKTLSVLTPITTAYTRVSDLFDLLLDILANGFGVVPAYTFNPPTAVDPNKVYAGLRLQSNKNFIAEETVAYTSNFTYNTSTCARDTGLIVDSIAFDLLYGGTSQSVFAGLQYWNQAGLVDGVGAEFIIINNSFVYLKNAIITIAFNAGGSTASDSYSSKFDSLIDIFFNGITGVTDKIQPNGFISSDIDIVAGYNAVIAAKTTLQTDTINWINSNNPGFSYNTATCYRDLGYVIDSTSFDVLHGGNRQSIMSGVYYYSYNSTSTAIPREIPQVIAAYDFINTISADIIKGNLITATYQTSVTQTVSTSTATNAEVRIIDTKINTITNIIVNGPSVAPPRVPINLTASTSTSVVNGFNLLLANKEFIKAETIAYINTSYVGVVYSTATCKRDVGYIIDAVTYDLLYQGNSQSVQAAIAYYDGTVFRISDTEKNATVAAYDFIKTIVGDIIVDNPITPLQNAVAQDLALIPATSVEAVQAQSLVYIIENVVKNAYSSTITIQENIQSTINDNTVVTFHKYSQIQSSSHNFEWIGAGTNINSALPYLGGTPISDNQAVAVNGGKVYFTGTDQQGDFRIGNELVINNNIGTISGRTFTKSLFAVMTPYILAIGK
jgi:hypothetical protein